MRFRIGVRLRWLIEGVFGDLRSRTAQGDNGWQVKNIELFEEIFVCKTAVAESEPLYRRLL